MPLMNTRASTGKLLLGRHGYEKLIEGETVEAHFEIDVELSATIVESIEKIIAEKRKGISEEKDSQEKSLKNFFATTLRFRSYQNQGTFVLLMKDLQPLKKMARRNIENRLLEGMRVQGRTNSISEWKDNLIQPITIWGLSIQSYPLHSMNLIIHISPPFVKSLQHGAFIILNQERL